MRIPRVYQVFAGGKTKRATPRLIHKNVKGQRVAIAKAKAYHEEHPEKYVGVFELDGVKVFKPQRKKK